MCKTEWRLLFLSFFFFFFFFTQQDFSSLKEKKNNKSTHFLHWIDWLLDFNGISTRQELFDA